MRPPKQRRHSWHCASSLSSATFPRSGRSSATSCAARPPSRTASYVAKDKTFCVYLAKDEAIIRKHAEISGFPATKITEISKMIDPTTERAD